MLGLFKKIQASYSAIRNTFVLKRMEGFASNEANRLTKLITGTGLTGRALSAINNNIIADLFKSRQRFDGRTSGRMRMSDASYMPWKSHLGYKYMLSYTFNYIDADTGLLETDGGKHGLFRLDTKQNIQRQIKDAIMRRSLVAKGGKSDTPYDIDEIKDVEIDYFVRFEQTRKPTEKGLWE